MDKYMKDGLELLRRIRPYRAVKFGKEGYDFERAQKEDPVVRDLCDRHSWTAWDLARIVYELTRRKRKGRIAILKVIVDRKDLAELDKPDPNVIPLWFMGEREVFGNFRAWEKIRNKIRCYILAGEKREDHSRELQREFNLYTDRVQKPGKPRSERNLQVREFWDDVEAEYKDRTEVEKAAELEYRFRVGLCDERLLKLKRRPGRLEK